MLLWPVTAARADAIELAVETAMRREELCGLMWEDVDLNRRVAHLRMTKNGEARDVPLSGRAIQILSSRTRPLRPLTVLRIKSPALSQAFRRVCQRLGLENLRWHDLRHEVPAGWPRSWKAMSWPGCGSGRRAPLSSGSSGTQKTKGA